MEMIKLPLLLTLKLNIGTVNANAKEDVEPVISSCAVPLLNIDQHL
jgi:hypothetical protein